MVFNPAGIPQDWTQISSLVDLLRYRALHQPEQQAYRFLKDGEKESGYLTYKMLDQQAQAIATHLQAQGALGARVLLTYPLDSGLEFIVAFFGCLYAGAIAVPAWPPLNQALLSEMAYKTNDADVAIALTTHTVRSKYRKQLQADPTLTKLNWIETDTIQLKESHWQAPPLNNSHLAYLQYSSGSTGWPKGAMISHGNVLNNLSLMYQALEGKTTQASDSGVCWVPLYHDMGLVGGVLQPIYAGRPVVMMSPVDFIFKPIRWLKAISHYQATMTGGPNFAYELCVRNTTLKERMGLDLSTWKIAINGAEPILAETLERFTTTFAPYGFDRKAFLPAYGMAETTVMISMGSRHTPPVIQSVQLQALEKNQIKAAPSEAVLEAPSEAVSDAPSETASTVQVNTRKLIGCGQVGADHRVEIVDPDTKTPCGTDQVGEIWISGPSVAQGYYNQLEATQQTFQAYLSTGEGPFLRTGDMGFLQGDELFITGRLKDVIILWGRNHYPHHIEMTVENSHPALRSGCGAVFGVDIEGEEQLVITHEVESRHLKQLDTDSVIQAIRDNLASHHALEAHAIVLTRSGSTPKTPTGKTQRAACRTQFLEGSLKTIGHWQNSHVAIGILVPEELRN